MEVLSAVTKRARREGIPADVRKALRRFCMLSLIAFCKKHGPACSWATVGRNKCGLCWSMLEMRRIKCETSMSTLEMRGIYQTSIARIWTRVMMNTASWTVTL